VVNILGFEYFLNTKSSMKILSSLDIEFEQLLHIFKLFQINFLNYLIIN